MNAHSRLCAESVYAAKKVARVLSDKYHSPTQNTCVAQCPRKESDKLTTVL